jgi:hypothetical protein
MRTITIEWFCFERAGQTCGRCTESYRSLQKAVERAAPVLKEQGIAVELKEHRVSEDNRDQSNFLTVNGRDIMDVLNERSDIFTFCRSCTELSGRPSECRTFIYRNRAYESIPEEMLEEALYREAGVSVAS